MSDVFVFDAYGTLFDVHSAVARHRDRLGAQAERLSELWRVKQLEYAWVRTLMDAHRDFAEATEAALDHSAARLGIALAADLRRDLLDAYARLDAFPDVHPVLETLRARGLRSAILSNGTPAMLAEAVARAGIANLLDAVISIEEAGRFKTDPSTYRLVTERFGVAPGAVRFHSSNRWDIAGAARFGFRCVWINRAGLPDEYPDCPPEAVVKDLSAIL